MAFLFKFSFLLFLNLSFWIWYSNMHMQIIMGSELLTRFECRTFSTWMEWNGMIWNWFYVSIFSQYAAVTKSIRLHHNVFIEFVLIFVFRCGKRHIEFRHRVSESLMRLLFDLWFTVHLYNVYWAFALMVMVNIAIAAAAAHCTYSLNQWSCTFIANKWKWFESAVYDPDKCYAVSVRSYN